MITSHGMGRLGHRLLLAFVLVALASVLMVAVAALIGSERGITASSDETRQQTAAEIAAAVATAFVEAGSWSSVDLAPAVSAAEAQGARLVVRDSDGTVVGGSELPGAGKGGMGRGSIEAPVTADGVVVGSAHVGFSRSATDTGRGIAWTWIAIASVAALAIAIVASWVVTRFITRPINTLTAASAAFASGDRSARARIDAPGEIGELARTFDAAADAIERGEQTRRNLSADIAHELRTPLTALLLGLEEVRDGLMPADEETLTRLHDQASRLGRVVNDLAALSAAEAPAPTTRAELIDLSKVVARCVDAHSAPLRAAGLTVATDLGGQLTVLADADRIDQIVGNLLSNTARYCRPGDTVTVRTFADGTNHVLEVADTGPGIGPDELPHVFDRFWRGSTATNAAGSGIGLAVVRALTQAQGGEVSATSDGRSGTTIRVSLPRRSQA